MGDMECAGACAEGTCYNPPPDDGGVTGPLWVAADYAAVGGHAERARRVGHHRHRLRRVRRRRQRAAPAPGRLGERRTGGTQATGWVDERTDPTGETLFAVSGTRVDDVWAVGANATIRHRTADGWTTIPTGPFALPAGAELHGVWAGAAQDVWVVGRTADGQSLVLHLNGGEWIQDRSFPGVGDLKAVSGSGSVVYVAGLGGSLYRFDGSAWSSMTSGAGAV